MRNTERLKQRDKNLVDKFHDLYDIRRKRLEDALRETSEVFFLDEDYVYKRIFYHKENKAYYESLQVI